MINFSKNKLVEEAQWARTDLVLKHCPGDTPVRHEANLRLYKAIEALEQEAKDLHVVVSGDKVPDAAKDTHPYFKLYRLEYHRHLATKKQMSEANGVMQGTLKECEKARKDATAQAWRYYDQIQELTALIMKMGGRSEIRT